MTQVFGRGSLKIENQMESDASGMLSHGSDQWGLHYVECTSFIWCCPPDFERSSLVRVLSREATGNNAKAHFGSPDATKSRMVNCFHSFVCKTTVQDKRLFALSQRFVGNDAERNIELILSSCGPNRVNNVSP